MKKTSKLFIVLTFILSLAFGMSTFAANNGNQTEATSALLSTIVSVAESIVASADMSVNASGDESFVTSSVSSSIDESAQESVNWKQPKEYMPYIQAALRENPDLTELDGHSIEIDDDRTLIIDGKSTFDSIDIPVSFYAIPVSFYSNNSRANVNGSTWIESYISNQIPFIPEDYSGEITTIERSYISPEDGSYNSIEYQVSKIMEEEDKVDGVLYGSEWFKNADGTVVKDEEGYFVSFYYPYYTESYHILYNFKLGELVKSFDLSDIVSPDVYEYKLYQSSNIQNGRILYNRGSLIGVFDTNTETFEVITTSCLDVRYNPDNVDGSILFIDWDRTEYSCEWVVSAESTKTGNTNVFYRYANFNLEKVEDFQTEFKIIQESLREGDDLSNYDVSYYGEITHNENSINMHLPYAVKYNSTLMRKDHFGCWLLEDNSLRFYYYGDVVVEKKFPSEGNWILYNANLSFYEDANVNYVIDVNNDDLIEAYELRNAIKQLDVVVYNETTNELYCWYNPYLGWRKLAEDVQEFYFSHNTLLWIDSQNNAYVNKWHGFNGNLLVGEDVVGVNMSSDVPGFIVKPDSPLCDFEYSGYHVYMGFRDLID